MLNELDHEQLIGLLNAVGGSGVDLGAVDDLTLAAILTNTIARVTDASVLDRALNKEALTYEIRAALRSRRLELDQLAKSTPKPAAPFPGLTVNIPERFASMTHYLDMNGLSREVRVTDDGRRVFDISPGEFRQVLLSGPQGKDWQDANAGAIERLAPGLHF